jgi:hypothetical protein
VRGSKGLDTAILQRLLGFLDCSEEERETLTRSIEAASTLTLKSLTVICSIALISTF